MPDAYRGLTIRIGGDTTELQKAIRSVNSAIGTTQTQLRKMTQALKMDPGNTEAIEKNLELVGQRAVEASSRLNSLRSAIRDVSSQRVTLEGGEQSLKTIQQLADETEDAALRASRAKEQYGLVVDELARVKNEIQGLTGVDLDEELNPDQTVESLRMAGQITDELAGKYETLRKAYHDAFNENETAKAVNGLADLRIEATRAEAEVNQLARQFSELSRNSALNQFGDGLDDRLRQIDAAAEQVTDSLTRASKALELDPSNVDAAEQKMRSLAESSDLAQMRLDLMEQKLSRMDDAGIGRAADDTRDVALQAQQAADAYEEVTAQVIRCQGEIASMVTEQGRFEARGDLGDEYQKLSNDIADARQELTRLEAAQESAEAAMDTAAQVQEYQQLKTSIAETRSEVGRINQEMRGSSSVIGGMSGSLMSLGLSLSTSVTPALAGLGAYAIQSASDMDSAYRDMRKTVDATEEEFVALRDAAIEFSMTNVTSADQIMSIQAIGGELGVATEDLKTFAETVSNLDIATNINAEDAATSLGQLSNILNDLNGDTMPNFSDALVRLGNNGASTESQIADIATRIGSMASIVGMSTPEILAWSSTIASTGQGAEAAGTAISNTIRDIETAVAKGGDSLHAFAEVAGMSADEFAAAWESDPSAALQAFIEGLNGIEADGGSALATLGELGITASRQTQAIQGLMQMIGGLNDNMQMSNDAWNGVSDQWGDAGDAAREAEKKAEGFSGAISILQNTAEALAAEFGESLTPIINALSDVLQGAYDVVNDLPDGFKQVTVAVAGLVAALGPGILLFRSIGEFVGDFKSLATQMRTTSKAADSLGDAVTGAATGFGGLKGALIGLGITAVAAGVVALVAQFQKAQEEARLLDQATSGLAEACQVADGSFEEAEMSSEEFGSSISELSDDVDDTRQRLADLATEFEDMNNAANGQISQLNNARDAISKYNGQANLTADEVSSLKSAVAQLNDQLGTNYEVVRSEDGTYNIIADGAKVATDEIYNLVDAQIHQIQVQNQLDKLSKLYEEQAAAASEYTEALNKQREAQERLNDAESAFNDFLDGRNYENAYNADPHTYTELANAVSGAQRDLSDLNSELDEAETNLNAADDAIATTEDSLDNMGEAASGAAEGFDALVKGSSALNDLFGGDADIMADFADALESTGISVEEFGDLSTSQLLDLADEWKRTGGDVNDILSGMATNVDFTSQTIQEKVSQLAQGVSEETTAAINAGLQASNMTLDQFAQKVELYGLVGEEQIAAYANGLASGDTTTVAAMKALQGTIGLEQYLSQYGIEGQDSIQAFIDAINAGDTWNAALKKAQDVASGINAGKPQSDAAAQNLSSSANSKLSQAGDYYDEWYNAAASIGRAIGNAAGNAVKEAKSLVDRVNAELSRARTSASVSSSGSSSGRSRSASQSSYSAMGLQSPLRSAVSTYAVPSADTPSLAAAGGIDLGWVNSAATHSVLSALSTVNSHDEPGSATTYEYNVSIDGKQVQGDPSLSRALRQFVDTAVRKSRGGKR